MCVNSVCACAYRNMCGGMEEMHAEIADISVVIYHSRTLGMHIHMMAHMRRMCRCGLTGGCKCIDIA